MRGRRHATRIPLYVPARAPPGLRDCWVVNVSATGMVLVGAVDGAAPKVDDQLETEFVVPQTQVRVPCLARVVWVDESNEGASHRVSLGLAFLAVPATARAFLAEHVAAYRPQVVMAFANAEQSSWVEELDASVQEVATVDELRDALRRGDVSAVVVFGERESVALEAVEVAMGQVVRGRRWGLQYRPGVIFCARASPEALLRLHNEGKLFVSLDPGADLETVSLALQQATQDHAVRSEQRRATLEHERTHATTVAPVAGPRDAMGIVYVSRAMERVIELIKLVARHRLPVLIAGETGTGKELVARAIHGLSPRADAPFVVQDCGVLSESLLESELFGHVRGAFTGATSDTPGLFGIADRGTIFLDEIENTTPALQAKLLRVIESGEMRSVGSARSRVVDVRVVAASNMNLLREVEAGRFRADLYYRLTAFPIEVPPLRDRREDIMPLAGVLLERASVALGIRPTGFSEAAANVLEAQEWRGNVRELRNIVERAVLLGREGQPLEPEQLPESMTQRGVVRPPTRSMREQLTEFERRLVREALQRHGGVLRRAALALKVNPMTLARRATRLGLWPAGGRKDSA